MAERLSTEAKNKHVEVLRESKDSGALTISASALASSEDVDAVLSLASFLSRAEFLNRLDDTTHPESEIRNLMTVFQLLLEHPSEATARLCETVYAEEDFRSLPSRLNLLLAALAAVRPVSASTAEIFRASSQEGFAEVNGPLLVKNEGPLALQVFEEIITLERVEPYVKVEILHRAVLPRRTRLPVLQMCDRLLTHELPAEVRAGVVETLFDEESRLWFGPAIGPPAAPPWDAADTEALEYLIAIGRRVLAAGVEDPLRGAVEATLAEVEGIVQGRQQSGRV